MYHKQSRLWQTSTSGKKGARLGSRLSTRHLEAPLEKTRQAAPIRCGGLSFRDGSWKFEVSVLTQKPLLVAKADVSELKEAQD